VLLKLRDTSYQELLEIFRTIEEQAYKEMQTEGFAPSELIFHRTIDMRYEGQSYEVNVPFDETFLDRFSRIYRQRFGYYSIENVIEIVNLRINAVAPVQRVLLHKERIRGTDASEALLGKRPTVISGEQHEVSVYDRGMLRPGNMVKGPAIVAEYSATTLIPPDMVCQVDEYSNLLVIKENEPSRGFK
jgi:N-methylhydantoinase A